MSDTIHPIRADVKPAVDNERELLDFAREVLGDRQNEAIGISVAFHDAEGNISIGSFSLVDTVPNRWLYAMAAAAMLERAGRR